MQKGKAQRRMAAELLKCGINRVWLDKDNMEKIATAITRDDIRRLIEKGFIKARQKKGTGRYQARRTAEKKRKGRVRGAGSKKGGKNSIVPKKRKWINTIRPLRRYLQALRQNKKINRRTYRKLYTLSSGGFFRNKPHLKRYMEKEGIEVK